MEFTLAVACTTGIHPVWAALVAPVAAHGVCLGVQYGSQGLLIDGTSHQLA